MGRISQDIFTQQSIEILAALRKLGEKVSRPVISNKVDGGIQKPSG